QNAGSHKDVVLEIQGCTGTVEAVMVHGMSGSALYANRFGSGFKQRCQISAIRGLGLSEGEEPAKTATEFSDSYMAGVKAARGTYPEVFGGICVGGLVAMEMAEGYFRRFRRRPCIVLIDPPPLGSAWLKPTTDNRMSEERTATLTRKVRFWRKIRDILEATNLGTTALGRKARRECFKKSLTRAFSGHVPPTFPCSILLIASSEWERATIDRYREWLPKGSDIQSVIIKGPHKGFHRTNPELIDQYISRFLDGAISQQKDS
ncbi:MAG: thioesterase domain-containing protein, partial [Paracoccaceae bacterium]